MRDFNDADRQKKKGRINLPENPDNLSQEALQDLETAVRGAARDGYVPVRQPGGSLPMPAFPAWPSAP